MSSIVIHLSEDGHHLVLAPGESLAFRHYRQFRQAYESAPDTVRRLTLDFTRTRQLDGAVIGMLGRLRRHAEARQWALEMCGCEGCVALLFEIFGIEFDPAPPASGANGRH